ncbi:hypothetical protein [Saliphagus sp. LR7]|uniref:hypothetical protein n=1 Tax=Saliphagus sp. LR7 TaxID=2282654 RepID=UPI000DF7433D|nr:hypothetical protein [Saliphagus sp. LR7]
MDSKETVIDVIIVFLSMSLFAFSWYVTDRKIVHYAVLVTVGTLTPIVITKRRQQAVTSL